MHKSLLVAMLGMGTYGVCHAQNKPLDSAAIANWPTVDGGEISGNGEFVAYHVGYENKIRWDEGEFVVWSAKTGAEKAYPGAQKAVFTRDNQFCVLSNPGTGDLTIRNLSNASDEVIGQVSDFQILENGKESRIIYRKKGSSDAVVYNPRTKTAMSLAGVQSYYPYGNMLIMVSKDDAEWQVSLTDPFSGVKQVAWHGSAKVSDVVVQKEKSQFAFVSDKKVWYCNTGVSATARELNIPASSQLMGMAFSGLGDFSNGGKILLLQYAGPSHPDTLPGQNMVRIFGYRDGNFDVQNTFEPRRYKVIYNLSTGTLAFPEDDKWMILGIGSQRSISRDDTYVVRQNRNAGGEYYWNQKQVHKISIIRAEDGKAVVPEIEGGFGYFSPTANYVIFQKDYGDYFSVNLTSGEIACITSGLPIPPTYNPQEDLEGSESRGFTFDPVWINQGDQFVIRDQYDFWLLDASGKHAPVNITNGYGRAHHLALSWPKEMHTLDIQKGAPVYFGLYNTDTKESGFCQIRWNVVADPKVLVTDRSLYGVGGPRYGGQVQKAADANVWLVQRQGTTESPNFYLTSNLTNFTPVSHVHPERDHEWFHSEVINYTTRDGVKSQAVLFIPDHLEPGKKYPVLFNWYEHETDIAASGFKEPAYTDKYYFNYARMLSEGYLVCVPDIHFVLGHTAQNIVDCVEGAADAIAQRPYVDSARYGASGGSFGGYGVNCVAALSRKFKAIVSISGLADMLNAYSNVPGLRDEEVENRQMRTGISLATGPETFLKNSPVAYTRFVTTPLLIIDNPKDVNVNPQQGIDWFINLRREGKLAWMLWYPNEDHGVFERDNQIDLGIRMDQFFDHYLKGAPVPRWMSEEMPAWERSGASGFQLMQGNEPGAGLNTSEDRQRQALFLQNHN